MGDLDEEKDNPRTKHLRCVRVEADVDDNSWRRNISTHVLLVKRSVFMGS